EDLDVMLADQRWPPRDPPGRAVIDGRLAGIREAAAELRMLDLLPEASVVEVWVVEELLGSSHRAPGKPAFLRGVVNLLGRQTGDEAADEIVDDVRRIRGDDRRVLVFWVPEIARHAVAVQEVGQLSDVFRVEAAAYQRADIFAVLGTELSARC